jgi:hypothetical protein
MSNNALTVGFSANQVMPPLYFKVEVTAVQCELPGKQKELSPAWLVKGVVQWLHAQSTQACLDVDVVVFAIIHMCWGRLETPIHPNTCGLR